MAVVEVSTPLVVEVELEESEGLTTEHCYVM